MTTTTKETFDVVPTRLAVQAMRDNGYKNAAYALAELIDNSIQAGATLVELLCGEISEYVGSRQRKRISQIAVLDNGAGMDAPTLRKALQFGNGTRLDDRSGMGRFGMGLPSSSISQCRRVEVWSWQSGPKSAVFSYLDLGEIEQGKILEVPNPVPKAIPIFWSAVASNIGKSGTLVVWSNLDRCVWKTGRAIIRNSEFLIGRMYRRFIYEGKAVVRMATVNLNEPSEKPSIDQLAVPNDPLYLMTPSSCPAPWDDQPMFEPFGERWEIPFYISHEGIEHETWVRFTHACEEAREGDLAGSRAHGRHARENIGVSIVRAGRELELSQSWVLKDPTERWWGVEIDFPASLDEVFGVSNNKQSARYLADAGALEIEELLAGRTVHEAQEEMDEDGDPLAPILEIAGVIKKTLGQIRLAQKQQKKATRSKRKRHLEPNSAEFIGTQATKKRQADGYAGESDKDESLPTEERQQELESLLEDQGYTTDDARDIASTTIKSGLKYIFTEAVLDTPAFFSVRPKAGLIHISLNMKHPAYTKLIEVLDSGEADEDPNPEELKRRLESASNGLKLLLEAWARLEDEQPDGKARDDIQELRTDWGRVARRFLADD